MTIRDAIAATVRGRSLTALEMGGVVEEMIDGRASSAQIGGLLLALRMKGESVEELCGAARALRCHAVPVRAPEGAVDTCGTGGDRCRTFNISTAAALIAAGAGVSVAKHGNRAISGVTGAADVFEALGVNLDASAAELGACLADVGIAFLFAPRLHPAMANVAAPRREIGVRTIFNLVGPLANPAGVRHQVVGVSDRRWIEPMTTALGMLGAERALVVHGRDGLDEITLTDATDVAELDEDGVRLYVLTPEDLGLRRCALSALQVSGAVESAAAVRGVLRGEPGPCRDVAIANAAAALYVAGRVSSVRAGAALAADAVDTGRAEEVLRRLVAWSGRAGHDS